MWAFLMKKNESKIESVVEIERHHNKLKKKRKESESNSYVFQLPKTKDDKIKTKHIFHWEKNLNNRIW